jgi:hypothetical protein
MSGEKRYNEAEAHQLFAISINGEVWELLDKESRTTSDDELMIHAAHASCYHWLQSGTGLHQQRGEWLTLPLLTSAWPELMPSQGIMNKP